MSEHDDVQNNHSVAEDIQEKSSQNDVTQESATLLQKVEAVLFIHGEPLPFETLAKYVDAEASQVAEAVEALAVAYAQRESGLALTIANDAVQLVTAAAVSDTIDALIKRKTTEKLSPASLEVLAIIAYRGPISRTDIEAIRGVNCAYTIRTLLLRGTIERIDHPTDTRTYLYRIAFDFLTTLGITRVEDLPDFAALAQDDRVDKIIAQEAAANPPKDDSHA